MKVTDIKTQIVNLNFRNTVIVKVETDDGVTGLAKLNRVVFADEIHTEEELTMRTGKAQVLTLPLFILALLLFVPHCLLGQSIALLTGTVIDPSGAVVQQAKVTCRNSETGLTHSIETDSQGLFRFPALPVGTYNVTASQSGFTPQTLRGILLVTGQAVDITVRLQLSQASQTVEVQAPAEEIQLTTSELQSSIGSKSMRNLPLNGRNPLQLTYLTPGTVNILAQNGSGVGWMGANLMISVNGNRGTDNDFLLDGVNFTDVNQGEVSILPNPDALQEFTVKSSNFSASQVGAGASVQFTTRSGTDQFHGEVFEFLRNNALDAKNYFAPGPKVPFKLNQFGGTFGGPIVKDRAFFFGSYQGTRQVGGASPATEEPPSAAQRTGDFSGFSTIYDPMTGLPFPENTIPTDRIDPLATKFLPYIPLPNQANGTYQSAPRANQNDDQVLTRFDYNLTSRDHLVGRYFLDRFDFQTGNAYRDFYGVTDFLNQSLLTSDTHTFSPNFLVVASIGYLREPRAREPVIPTTMQALGAQAPLAQLNVAPALDVNLGSYGLFEGSGELLVHPQTWEYRTDFTLSHEEHMLNFGLDLTRNNEYSIDPAFASGYWIYDGSRTSIPTVPHTGDSFADFLLGLPASFTQSAVTAEDIVGTNWMPWIEDNWRVRPTLTLNLGLQWAPWLPAGDRLGAEVGWEPGVQSAVAPNAPLGLVFSGDRGIPHAIWRHDWNNFAPRVGFAWNVGGSGRTVIRAAYGVFYRPVPFNLQRFALPGAAFRGLSTSFVEPLSTENPYGNIPGGSPFPWTPPTASQLKTYVFTRPVVTTAFTPTSRSSYVQEWNLAVQRQLSRSIGVTLTYIGNHMIKGIGERPGNVAIYGPGATLANVDQRRPYAGIGDLSLLDSFQYSKYDAVQFSVEIHEQRLTLLGNYAYSKCMDNESNDVGSSLIHNLLNPNKDYARCDSDMTQVANLSAVYGLPQVAAPHGFVGKIANNWQLTSILTLHTGFPFYIASGVDNSLSGPEANDLADQISRNTARPRGVSKLQEYFNTAAYVPNALGTFGNSGRNSLTSPGTVEWDFGLLKDIPITKQVETEFRFEAFNLVNYANFDPPVSTLTSSNFGRILTAESPRVLQFAMKLRF